MDQTGPLTLVSWISVQELYLINSLTTPPQKKKMDKNYGYPQMIDELKLSWKSV